MRGPSGCLVDCATGAAHAIEDRDQAEVWPVSQNRIGVLALIWDLAEVEGERSVGPGATTVPGRDGLALRSPSCRWRVDDGPVVHLGQAAAGLRRMVDNVLPTRRYHSNPGHQARTG